MRYMLDTNFFDFGLEIMYVYLNWYTICGYLVYIYIYI